MKKNQNSEKHQESMKKSSFSSNVAIIGLSQVVLIISLFAEMMVAVRLLDTDSYGIYVLMVVASNFFMMAIDLGFKTATTQLIASNPHEKQTAIVGTVYLFRIFALFILSFIIWFGRKGLAIFDSSEQIIQYAVYIPFMLIAMSLDELFQSTLQGFQYFKVITVAIIMRSILRFGLTLLFLTVFNLGLMALIYSWILSFAFSTIFQFVCIPTSKYLYFNFKILVEILRFGFPLQINRFIWFAIGRINAILLGTFTGPIPVAFYSIGDRIPKAFQSFSEAFLTVFFPNITKLLAEHKYEKAKWMLDQSIRLMSFILSFAALFCVLISKQIIVILFTEKYIESHTVFSLLMLALHMGFLIQIMGYTLTSAGYPSRSLFGNGIQALILVIGSIILIPKYGIVGAASATLTAAYLSNPVFILLLYHSKIKVEVKLFVQQIFILLFCITLFLWLNPVLLIYKSLLLLIFCFLNFLIKTVTLKDFELIYSKILPNKKLQPIE